MTIIQLEKDKKELIEIASILAEIKKAGYNLSEFDMGYLAGMLNRCKVA